ncbi:MAG: 2-oxo acid dehydrogenase subunit, partial [Acidobacteria bacterium]|nr:2-oxo acid dehydrogenase subunit [Acidobacteriota bacterium]
MGTHVIRMPDIGEGIAEVELVEWHVAVGDRVREDQTLADVMTDKATVEIPSPVAGVVRALGGKVGEVLAVGSELVRLEVDGEGNVGAADAPRPRAVPAATGGGVAPAAAPAPAAAVAQTAPPVVGRTLRAPGDKPIASPAVRRRAWDLGIDLRQVAGSGPAGRILQSDLDAFAAGAVAPIAAPSRHAAREGAEVVPVIGLRRRIAQRMQESKRRIPHFSYVEEVDVSELEVL